MKTRFFSPPKPRLFGHRGSDRYPENTLPAFQDALKAGIPYLELDVWSSRDKVIMVHHDRNLLRVCGVNRDITDLALNEILQLDAGFNYSSDKGRTHPARGRNITVPPLKEVLADCSDALFNIEIKQTEPGIEQQVLAVVEQMNMLDRVLLASEKDSVTKRLRLLCNDVPTNLSFGEAAAFFAWVQSGRRGEYRPPGKALQIPVAYQGTKLVTPESVRTAHEVGLEVHVWTVNNFSVMEQLLEMGVDGIMSDRPDLLAQVAKKYIH